MSTRNLIRAIQKLPRRTRKLSARLVKGFFAWLLRRLYVLWHRPTTSTAGFVLPTTILLLLMVALTAGALTYRSFSRSEQAIAKREQQVITNSATPAVNRAQSKLEFLFLKDDRFPGGVPSSNVLQSMMLDDGNNGITAKGGDPYTLPDETRIDLDGNAATLENAWVFPSDVNGDGVVAADELAVYSILMDDQTVDGSGNPVFSADDPQEPDKAKAMVTRNGPITTTEPGNNCNTSRAPEGGWTVLGTGSASVLQKNFQVDAFVRNGSDVNRTVETLEFQQIREAARGNKWGAWFRNDLEVFPFSQTVLNWNGAMHTEGNFIVSSTFEAHMISAKDSCLYSAPASEISIKSEPARGYRGQFVIGEIGNKNDFFSGSGDPPNIHYDNAGTPVENFPINNSNNDSVAEGPTATPADIALNPIAIFTEGRSEHNNDTTWAEDADFDTGTLVSNERIVFDDTGTVPTLDDFYRADDRWGPVAQYSGRVDLPTGTKIGESISGNAELTDPSSGLDGYWERRALAAGLRLIVGQRLELGNAFGWQGNNDPLYPPIAAKGNTAIDNNVWFPGPNETRQFRALRDNLAAVQGMVVYHYQGGGGATDGTTPLACYAMTAHPGTGGATGATIENSRTFAKYTDTPGSVEYYKSDFLSGVGTNGWEFTYPFASTDYASSAALGKALRNLATFAGDPEGGAPAFPAVQEDGSAASPQVHPLPYISMWGDYSMLNRLLDGAFASAYTSASAADKTIYESAACTLGLLSYNINALEAIATELLSTGGPLATLATTLNTSFTYATDDEFRVLEEWVDKFPGLTADEQERLILMSQYFQQIRDRAYGFSSTGTIDANVTSGGTSAFGGNVTAPSSGPYAGQAFNVSCDPTLFSSVTGDFAEQLTLALVLCPSTSTLQNRVVRYPALYYLFPYADHDHTDGQPAAEGYIDENSGPGKIFATADPDRFEIVAPADIVTSGGSLVFEPREIGSWIVDNGGSLGAVGITADPAGPGPADVNQIIAPDGNTYNVAMLDKGMYDGRENMALRVLDLDLNILTKERNGAGDYWIPADTNGGAEGIVYAFREDAAREDEIVRPFGDTWANCNTVANLTNNGVDSTVFPPAIGTIGSCQMDVFAPQDPPLNSATGISPKPVDYYSDPDRRPYGFRLKNGRDISDGNNRDVGMTFITDNSVYVYGYLNIHSTNGVDPNLEEFTNPLLSLTTDGTTYTDDFYDRVAADLDTNRFATLATDHWRPVELLADSVGILSTNFKDGSAMDGFVEESIETLSSGLSSYQNQDRPYFTNNAGRFDYGNWYHENPLDNTHVATPDPKSPILVPRNGNYFDTDAATGDPLIAGNPDNTQLYGIDTTTPLGQSANDATDDGNVDWISFIHKQSGGNGRVQDYRQYNMIGATPTYANAVIISGIVPSRAYQSYGGLHNFPRLLERWSSANALYISGAFFQLNFSTGSTGPYDADAWEPQQGPKRGGGSTREFNHYYGPPDRRWGYDVGLQYVSPAPISRRFVTVGAPRSEYYRELPSDDPYMMLLRCARNDSAGNAILGGDRIDPTADAACTADYGL